MRLHYSAASPYVRKVVVVAHETGLFERLELDARTASPVKPDESLNHDNPIGKVPCLITEAGLPLYDSRVICEFLDSLHRGAQMFPVDRAERWLALRRQALADGILDAAVGTRYETFLRPPDKRWDEWIRGQKLKIGRALDTLDQEADGFEDVVDIGTIAIGCALGYLDFRHADRNWRAVRPALAAWEARFAERPAMQATRPA